MRVFEFLKEKNGQFSSSRLFMLLVALSAIIDWQHAIWTTVDGIWRPEWTTIGMVLGVLGFKIAQKPFEKANDKADKAIEEKDSTDDLG